MRLADREGVWEALLDPFFYLGAAKCGGGLFLFARGFAVWRRARRAEDTPTSKIRSMAMGFVELRGRARALHLVEAPLSGRPCLYYRYRITREDEEARELASGRSSARGFFLDDDTGRVWIEAEDANLELSHPSLWTKVPDMNPSLRATLRDHGVELEEGLVFREWRIDPGDLLYVLGTVRPWSLRRRVAARLAAIKRDPVAMEHADRDRDGRVSEAEWEQLRQRVERETGHTSGAHRAVVGSAREERAPFVITKDPERAFALVSKLRSACAVAVGSILSVDGFFDVLWFAT